jgi:hypothetical protein
VSDEAWVAICNSPKTHPTLEAFNLQTTRINVVRFPLAPAKIKFWIQALVDMLKVNTSIHNIRLHNYFSEHELFCRSVIPRLETNRFRTRVLAIQKTRPFAYRAKVLGRALLAARTDRNCFWMLVSGNAEVVFPSTTATTTPATALAIAPTTPTADLPTHAPVATATSPVIDAGSPTSEAQGTSLAPLVPSLLPCHTNHSSLCGTVTSIDHALITCGPLLHRVLWASTPLLSSLVLFTYILKTVSSFFGPVLDKKSRLL